MLGCLAGFLLLAGAAVEGRQRKPAVLRIGTSGTVASPKAAKQKAALGTLRDFIKEETGLNNEILRQKDWRALAGKLAKGELDLGVFQGHEFAWAQKEQPGLEPLALAINVHRYPVGYVMVRKDSKAKDFAGLRGGAITLPASGLDFLRVFVSRLAQQNGKRLEEFFSTVKTQESIEDALDDVVDGTVQAAAADRAALDAYKRRKPGRFKQLREVARSEPFLPGVVAYHGRRLDEALRRRFRAGLLGAARKEKGRMMLTLFRLTGFETVPADFTKVAARVQKAYPPPPRSDQPSAHQLPDRRPLVEDRQRPFRRVEELVLVVDAQDVIHRRQHVAGGAGARLRVLRLGIGGADHLAHLQPAAGEHD
jgi:ABC-type phosphate/phosphonate transport system substrate-binding protein